MHIALSGSRQQTEKNLETLWIIRYVTTRNKYWKLIPFTPLDTRRILYWNLNKLKVLIDLRQFVSITLWSQKDKNNAGTNTIPKVEISICLVFLVSMCLVVEYIFSQVSFLQFNALRSELQDQALAEFVPRLSPDPSLGLFHHSYRPSWWGYVTLTIESLYDFSYHFSRVTYFLPCE